MVDEDWQLSIICLTRYFAVLVERRVVGEMAIFANHHNQVTTATHHPIRSSASFRPPRPTCYPILVAYNAHLLPFPSTANPSHSLVTIDTRPILQTLNDSRCSQCSQCSQCSPTRIQNDRTCPCSTSHHLPCSPLSFPAMIRRSTPLLSLVIPPPTPTLLFPSTFPNLTSHTVSISTYKKLLPTLYPVTLLPAKVTALTAEYRILMKVHHPDLSPPPASELCSMSTLQDGTLTPLRGSSYYLHYLSIHPDDAGALITQAHATLKKQRARVESISEMFAEYFTGDKQPATDPDMLEYSMDMNMEIPGANMERIGELEEEHELRVAASIVMLEGVMGEFGEDRGDANRAQESCGEYRYLNQISVQLEGRREALEAN